LIREGNHLLYSLIFQEDSLFLKSQNQPHTVYFSDFDGTIAQLDIGDTILRHFGDPSWQDYARRYALGEINSQECLRGEFATLRATKQQILQLVDTLELDPTFPEFVRKVHERGDELIVLSDGQSYYLEHMLAKYDVHVPFYANRAVFENGGVKLEFPHLNPDCEVNAANCKCSHMPKHPSERRVYIGDGTSDRCAAGKTDLVYAKGPLLEWAKKQPWNYRPFRDFADVMAQEGF